MVIHVIVLSNIYTSYTFIESYGYTCYTVIMFMFIHVSFRYTMYILYVLSTLAKVLLLS